jgi:hypothetical protein
MGSDLIRRSGADQSTKADGKNSGMTVDPGPYEAVVVRHIEGTRMGQLEVYIPDRDGTFDPNKKYTTVSYASPFYGTTYGTDRQNLPDSAATAGQSYGMWMIPPDIGCKVLVTFVAGDLGRGYWFACVYDSPSHHMIPALGRAIGEKTGASTALGSKVTKLSPVVEYSTTDPKAFTKDALVSTTRYPHELQTSVLLNQGLDRDPVRGAISSSSLREAPSNVYGISTPGRKATASNQVPGKPQDVIYRKGGHTFVMDDGAAGDPVNKEGTDQLIRLRSSGGHQILMNDTEQVLYIASASGHQWLEFSNNGQINIYADGGFNVRSKGTLNLHSDKRVNIQGESVHISASGKGITLDTDGKINLSSMSSMSLKSVGAMTLHSMSTGAFSAAATFSATAGGAISLNGDKVNLNNGGGSPPSPPTAPTTKSFTDVALAGGMWTAGDSFESICTVAPTHEPWGTAGKRPK